MEFDFFFVSTNLEKKMFVYLTTKQKKKTS